MSSSDEDDFLTAAEKKDLLTEALEEMKRKVAQIQESNRNQRAEIVVAERDVEFTRKELEKLTVEKEALQLEAEGLEDQLQTLILESQMVEQHYEEMRKKVERIETVVEPQFQKSMSVVLDNLNTIVNVLYEEGIISDQPCPESEYLPITPVLSASESLQLVAPKSLPGTPMSSTTKSLPEVQPKSLPVTPMSSTTKCLPEVQPEYLPITPVPSASESLPLVAPKISSTKKMKISEVEIEEEESSIKKPKMLKDHIKETEIYEIEEGGKEEEEELVEEQREEEKLEVSDPKSGTTTELPSFLTPYVPKKKSPNDKWPIKFTAFVNYYFQTNFKGKFSQQFIDDCIQQGRAYDIFPSLAKQADDTLYKQVYTRMATLKRQMVESKRKTE